MNRQIGKSAVVAAVTCAVSAVALVGGASATSRAVHPGQCGGNVSDYTLAPGVGGSVAFVLSGPYTQDGTKVKSVKFNEDLSLTVVSTDPTATAQGAWLFEQPNGVNPGKKGVATFVTVVTRAEETQQGAVNATYQSVFTVTEPVCNPLNALRPTDVFQLRGDRTVTYTTSDPTTGEVFTSKTGADGAYQGDR